MSKLNYLDYAYDIGKIEKVLEKENHFILKDILEENISKEKTIEIFINIMKKMVEKIEELEEEIDNLMN